MEAVEETRLLSILPEEVWLIILDKITARDSKKAYHFYNTTISYFQKLLHPNLNEFVFPFVITVLHMWCEIQPNKTNQADVAILPFRKVCQKWKNEVDFFLQRRLHARDSDSFDQICYHIENTASELTYNFKDVQSLELFQQQFDDTHLPFNANPFLTSAIKFSLSDRNVQIGEIQDYLRECVEMLTKYGAHVNCCVINIKHSSDHDCLSWLGPILRLIPNVKMLIMLDCTCIAMFPNWKDLGFNVFPTILVKHTNYL